MEWGKKKQEEKLESAHETMPKGMTRHPKSILGLNQTVPNETERIQRMKETAKSQSSGSRKFEDAELFSRTNQYKPSWNKNGIIQYKTDKIAILQRSWGRQVEFIIAYDDLTKEGYRLMAIDEGKEGGQASGGFTGGVNAYFYFQKMEYVR